MVGQQLLFYLPKMCFDGCLTCLVDQNNFEKIPNKKTILGGGAGGSNRIGQRPYFNKQKIDTFP